MSASSVVLPNPAGACSTVSRRCSTPSRHGANDGRLTYPFGPSGGRTFAFRSQPVPAPVVDSSPPTDPPVPDGVRSGPRYGGDIALPSCQWTSKLIRVSLPSGPAPVFPTTGPPRATRRPQPSRRPPGCAAVATHSLPGDREHVFAPHLVAQRVEPEVRSFLRFRMQHCLESLNCAVARTPRSVTRSTISTDAHPGSLPELAGSERKARQLPLT